jgi:hypothetical protein
MDIVGLRAANRLPILELSDPSFARYGRVLTAFDVQELSAYAEAATVVDAQRNTYVASVPAMEAFPVVQQIANTIYGGMPIEVGYCNGPNSTLNGLEYHKSPEVFIAVTDCIQIVGHTQDIVDFSSYDTRKTEVFFFPAGAVVESYASTLHFGPCKTRPEGFKSIIILPIGTNTPLEKGKADPADPETRLLFMRNKWLLAHPARVPLIQNGAWPGLVGPNIEIHLS